MNDQMPELPDGYFFRVKPYHSFVGGDGLKVELRKTARTPLIWRWYLGRTSKRIAYGITFPDNWDTPEKGLAYHARELWADYNRSEYVPDPRLLGDYPPKKLSDD